MSWEQFNIKITADMDFGNALSQVNSIKSGIDELKGSIAEMPNVTRVLDNSFDRTATVADSLADKLEKLQSGKLSDSDKSKVIRDANNDIAELNALRDIQLGTTDYSAQIARRWFGNLPQSIKQEFDAMTPKLTNIIRTRMSSLSKYGNGVASQSATSIAKELLGGGNISKADPEISRLIQKYNFSSEAKYQLENAIKYLIPAVSPMSRFKPYQQKRFGYVREGRKADLYSGKPEDLFPESFKETFKSQGNTFNNFDRSYQDMVLDSKFKAKIDEMLRKNPVATKAALASGIARRDNRGILQIQDEITRAEWENYRKELYDDLLLRVSGYQGNQLDAYKATGKNKKTLMSRLTSSSSGRAMLAMHDIEELEDTKNWVNPTGNRTWRSLPDEGARILDEHVVNKYSPFMAGAKPRKVMISESHNTRLLGQNQWKNNQDVSDTIAIISLAGYDEKNKGHQEALQSIFDNGKTIDGRKYIAQSIHGTGKDTIVRMIEESAYKRVEEEERKWIETHPDEAVRGIRGSYWRGYEDEDIQRLIKEGITAKDWGKHLEMLNKPWTPTKEMGVNINGKRFAVVNTRGFGDGGAWFSSNVIPHSGQFRGGIGLKGSAFVFQGNDMRAFGRKTGLIDNEGRVMMEGPDGQMYDVAGYDGIIPLDVIKNKGILKDENGNFVSGDIASRRITALLERHPLSYHVDYDLEGKGSGHLGTQMASFMMLSPAVREHQIEMAMKMLNELDTESGQIKHVFSNQNDYLSRKVNEDRSLLSTDEARARVDAKRNSIMNSLLAGQYTDFEDDTKIANLRAAANPLASILLAEDARIKAEQEKAGQTGAHQVVPNSVIEKARQYLAIDQSAHKDELFRVFQKTQDASLTEEERSKATEEYVSLANKYKIYENAPRYTDQEIRDMIVLPKGKVIDFNRKDQKTLSVVRAPTGFGNMYNAENLAAIAEPIYRGMGISTSAGIYVSEEDRDRLQTMDFDADQVKAIYDEDIARSVKETLKDMQYQKSDVEAKDITYTPEQLKSWSIQNRLAAERNIKAPMGMGTGSSGVRVMQIDYTKPYNQTLVRGAQRMAGVYDIASTPKSAQEYILEDEDPIWKTLGLGKEFTKFTEHKDELFKLDDDMLDEYGNVIPNHKDVYHTQNGKNINLRALREMKLDEINLPSRYMANHVMALIAGGKAYRQGGVDTSEIDAIYEAMNKHLDYGDAGPARKNLMQSMRMMMMQFGTGERTYISTGEAQYIDQMIEAASAELAVSANDYLDPETGKYKKDGKTYANKETFISAQEAKYGIRSARNAIESMGMAEQDLIAQFGEDYFHEHFQNVTDSIGSTEYNRSIEIREEREQLEEKIKDAQQRVNEENKGKKKPNKKQQKKKAVAEQMLDREISNMAQTLGLTTESDINQEIEKQENEIKEWGKGPVDPSEGFVAEDGLVFQVEKERKNQMQARLNGLKKYKAMLAKKNSYQQKSPAEIELEELNERKKVLEEEQEINLKALDMRTEYQSVLGAANEYGDKLWGYQKGKENKINDIKTAAEKYWGRLFYESKEQLVPLDEFEEKLDQSDLNDETKNEMKAGLNAARQKINDNVHKDMANKAVLYAKTISEDIAQELDKEQNAPTAQKRKLDSYDEDIKNAKTFSQFLSKELNGGKLDSQYQKIYEDALKETNTLIATAEQNKANLISAYTKENEEQGKLDLENLQIRQGAKKKNSLQVRSQMRMREINSLRSKIDKQHQEGNYSDEEYEKMSSELDELEKKAKPSMIELGDIAGNIKGQVASTATYMANMFGRQVFQKAVAEIKRFVREFNQQMTTIQMITLKTDSEMAKIGDSLIDKAKELKISVSEISQSAATLYRQGLSDEEVNERLDVVSKFSKVSGTKVEDATKLITIALNTGLVQSATEASDIVTALGDNAATNAQQIEKGIEKAGAAAAADGTTFGQLAAMLTAITATTQIGGNVAGRTLNTIFGRMNKIGTNELIYDENGNAISGSEISKLLKRQGIETYDKNGNKRSSFDVLYELSQKWDNLGDAERQQLATAIAGTRQYSNFASIMQGMSEGKIDEYMNLIGESSGITDQKFEVYTKSLEAALTNLKNTFDELVNDLTSSGVLTGALDVISQMIKGVDNLANAIGGVGAALLTAIPLLTAYAAIQVGLRTGKLEIAAIGLGTAAALGLGTYLLGFNGKEVNTTTATERLSESNEKYQSRIGTLDTDLSRIKELKENKERTSEEDDEYKSLLYTYARQFGIADNMASGAATSIDALSEAIKGLGEDADKVADEILSKEQEEKDKEWAEKLYRDRSDTLQNLVEEKTETVKEYSEAQSYDNSDIFVPFASNLTGKQMVKKLQTWTALQRNGEDITHQFSNAIGEGILGNSHTPRWEEEEGGQGYFYGKLFANAAANGYIEGDTTSDWKYWSKKILNNKITPEQMEAVRDYIQEHPEKTKSYEEIYTDAYYNTFSEQLGERYSDEDIRYLANYAYQIAREHEYDIESGYKAVIPETNDPYQIYHVIDSILNSGNIGKTPNVSELTSDETQYYVDKNGHQITKEEYEAEYQKRYLEEAEKIVNEYNQEQGAEEQKNFDENVLKKAIGLYNKNATKKLEEDQKAAVLDLIRHDSGESSEEKLEWIWETQIGETGQNQYRERAIYSGLFPEKITPFDQLSLEDQEKWKAIAIEALGGTPAATSATTEPVKGSVQSYIANGGGLIRPVRDAIDNRAQEIAKEMEDEYTAVSPETFANESMYDTLYKDQNKIGISSDVLLSALAGLNSEDINDILDFVATDGQAREAWNALKNGSADFARVANQIKFNPATGKYEGPADIVEQIKTSAAGTSITYGSIDRTVQEKAQMAMAGYEGLINQGWFQSQEQKEQYQDSLWSEYQDNVLNLYNERLKAIQDQEISDEEKATQIEALNKEFGTVYDDKESYLATIGVMSKEQGTYLKELIGSNMYKRVLDANAGGTALTEEEQEYINKILNNRAYGLTSFTSKQQLENIKEVQQNIDRLGIKNGYSRTVADQYMANWSGWSEYASLVEARNKGQDYDKTRLAELEQEFANYQRDLKIKIDVEGVAQLEEAGEVAKGTLDAIKQLQAGGKVAIDVILNYQAKEFSKGQMRAKLQNGTIAQQDEAIMALTGATKEQLYATDTSRAYYFSQAENGEQADRELEIAGLWEQYKKATPQQRAGIRRSAKALGYNINLAGYTDLGAPEIANVGTLVGTVKTYSDVEKNQALQDIISGKMKRVEGSSGNADLYDAAVASAGFYASQLVWEQQNNIEPTEQTRELARLETEKTARELEERAQLEAAQLNSRTGFAGANEYAQIQYEQQNKAGLAANRLYKAMSGKGIQNFEDLTELLSGSGLDDWTTLIETVGPELVKEFKDLGIEIKDGKIDTSSITGSAEDVGKALEQVAQIIAGHSADFAESKPVYTQGQTYNLAMDYMNGVNNEETQQAFSSVFGNSNLSQLYANAYNDYQRQLDESAEVKMSAGMQEEEAYRLARKEIKQNINNTVRSQLTPLEQEYFDRLTQGASLGYNGLSDIDRYNGLQDIMSAIESGRQVDENGNLIGGLEYLRTQDRIGAFNDYTSGMTNASNYLAASEALEKQGLKMSDLAGLTQGTDEYKKAEEAIKNYYGSMEDAIYAQETWDNELSSKSIQLTNKYGDSTQTVASNVSALAKGGKTATQTIGALRQQMTQLSNVAYAIKSSRGKSGKEIGQNARNDLAAITGESAENIYEMSKEQLASLLDRAQGAIDEDFVNQVGGTITERLNQLFAENEITADMAVKFDVNADGELDLSEIEAIANELGDETLAILAQHAGTIAELFVEIEKNGLSETATAKLVKGSVSGNGKRTGGGGGGGKSEIDKLLEEQKHKMAELEHQNKMLDIEKKHNDLTNDYDTYNQTLEDQIALQGKIREAYKENIAELENMLSKTKENSDDWWKLKDAIYAAQEAMESVKNTIAELNAEKISILDQKIQNEDKPDTHAGNMLQKMAQRYQTNGDFANYEAIVQKQLDLYRTQIDTNALQLREYENLLLTLEENSDAWIEARDKIWEIKEENAELENQIISGEIELDRARINQLSTEYQQETEPYEHLNNMLNTYGGMYQRVSDYAGYRSMLSSQNESNASKLAYTRETIRLIEEEMETLEKGSVAWYEARSALYQYEETEAQLNATILENNQAIGESKVEELTDEYAEATKHLNHELTMLQAAGDEFQKEGDLINYQETLKDRIDVSTQSVEAQTKSLAKMKEALNDPDITDSAYKSLVEQIENTEESIQSTTNSIADLNREANKVALNILTEAFNYGGEGYSIGDTELQHDIQMYEYEGTRYKNRGELTNYGKLLEGQNELQKARSANITKYIADLKKQKAAIVDDDEAIKELDSTIYKWEEELSKVNNKIEQNEKALEQNVVQILKTRQAVESQIDSEIRKRIQEEKDRLAATVSIENTIIETIRKNAKEQWDLEKKTIQKKKEALSQEKSLLNERLQARKNAIQTEEKYEEIARLKQQLALIQSDSSRTKEAKELTKQIADLEKEMAWQIADEQAAATSKMIDDQISAYDDYVAKQEEDLNEYLENTNNFREKLDEILNGSVQDFLDFMHENSEEYKNATVEMQAQMDQGWTDTFKKMKGELDTYWNEVDENMRSREGFVEYMKQSTTYQAASATGQAILEANWGELYDAFTSAYLDTTDYTHGHETDVVDKIDELKDWTFKIEFDTERNSFLDLAHKLHEVWGVSRNSVSDYDPYDNYTGVGYVAPLEEPAPTSSPSSGGSGPKTTAAEKEEYKVYGVNPQGQPSMLSVVYGSYSDADAALERARKNGWTSLYIVYPSGKSTNVMYSNGTKYNTTSSGTLAFAEGGLVDYTGLAMVHGTPQHPEAFLDSEDRSNIRAMLDMFAYVKTPYMSNIDTSKYGNDYNFGDVNVTINEAQINNDQDVAELAKKIGNAFTKELTKNGLNNAAYAW